MRKFESAAMLAALAWAFIFGQAAAQTISYPQRPVRILVGLAPGGNPDVLARLLAAKLTEAFGQQFLVENRPGAGNAIAVDAVARSQPDGHTIFVGTSGVVTTNPHVYKELPYDPFRDILPVSLAAVVPMWLVVHPSVPARSVQELVALARAQKQPMPYASSGNGSIHHLTMEAFKSETRVDFSHVPYKGASQSVPAMIAGEVALGFVGYPALASAVQAGRLRVLAFSLSSTLTPEVPTVAETVAPGFDMSAPLGVFVGAGTGRELVARLSQAISEAVRSPDLVGRMSAIGMEPVGSTPEEYAKTLREEHQRFGVLIKRIGMRLD